MEGANLATEVKRFMAAVEAANPDMVTGVRISTAWHSCVDEKIRKHTDAVYSVPGSGGSDVIIYVDSSIWAADLNLQTELLRLRLNVALRDMDEASNERPPSHEGAMFDVEDLEVVKRLRFIVSKESYRTKEVVKSTEQQLEEQNPPKVQPEPLSAAEEAALRAITEKIEDERVREAAYNAAKAGLELEKASGQ